MSKINILIVDDHAFLRRTLRSLIESHQGWRVCGEAADGVEAVQKTRELRPDLVLMDISMPRMDGVQATQVIRKEVPGSEVIIVSQNEPVAVSREISQLDIVGYVTKGNVARELVPLIEKAGYQTPTGTPNVSAATQGISKFAETAAHESGAFSKPALEWLVGGGEMAGLVRAKDWSRTPLGPIEQWPQSLKTSVSICLASRFPIVMYWGPEYVVLYNDAYSSILGSKHPWALGQCCRDCWSEIWDTIGPMLDGVVNSAQATWSDDFLLMLQRHGYAEECYFSFSFSPIRIETGAVGGVFTAVMETTEKVIGERRLQILRDLAARAVDAQSEQDACQIAAEVLGHSLHDIPFSVLCQVGAGKQIEVLCTAGIDSQNILCRSLRDPGSALHKQVLQTAYSNEIYELDGAEGFAKELPHGPWQTAPRTLLLLPIADRGESRGSSILLAAVSPHKKPDDSYRTFFQLVAHQIGTNIADARSHDEERRRAEALAELDRAKTLFFSNVSHEFRTPLTLMLGPLEDMLAVGDRLSNEQREKLKLAHRNSLRLLKLVNTLLDFSRIEAGRIQACYQLTELSSFTAELAGMFHSATDRAGLKLIIDCAQIGDPVYVDREMWEKIVFNLLSNAFKFTFQGEIAVSLRAVNGRAELTVRDTGTGIPAQDVPRLFERFYRVKNARGRTFEGSGIGLSLVQELVRLHGGTVRVESKENEGSTFIVAVPFGKDHLPSERVMPAQSSEFGAVGSKAYVQEALRWLPGAETATDDVDLTSLLPSPEPVFAPGGSSGTRPYVLLADDNADMREYVQRLLRQSYEVHTVANGEAAVSSARERRPDLIVADIMMPKLDGFGLVQAVRQDGALRDVPVMLLSARAGDEARVEGLDAGADDYLVKPFSARELLARVRSHLTMARMRSERTEVERRLRMDSELLASIVASSDDAIVSKNLDGVITSWNKGAERIFGYSAKEAIGQHITLIIPGARRDEENDILARLRQGERIDHFDTVRRRKDGTLLDVSLTISPLRDSTGRIVGASKVARDISLQKRVDQALRESEENYRKLAEELEAQVRARTRELEQRNAEVLTQSEQLRELSWQMLQIQEQERRHIARELHDSAGQTLTVLGMNLSMLVQNSAREAPGIANEAEKIQELVQQLHREIRTASYLLHPPLLDESGLSSALRWYVEGLIERSGLAINLDISKDFGRMPSEMELMIFRLVQECLTNIHRHSGSNTAFIRISRDAEAISVEIEDEGKGLSSEKLAAIQSGGSGVGIRGMRERLRQFHGQLNIDSDRSGTRIRVTIPVPKTARHNGVEPLQAAV